MRTVESADGEVLSDSIEYCFQRRTLMEMRTEVAGVVKSNLFGVGKEVSGRGLRSERWRSQGASRLRRIPKAHRIPSS